MPCSLPTDSDVSDYTDDEIEPEYRSDNSRVSTPFDQVLEHMHQLQDSIIAALPRETLELRRRRHMFRRGQDPDRARSPGAPGRPSPAFFVHERLARYRRENQERIDADNASSPTSPERRALENRRPPGPPTPETEPNAGIEPVGAYVNDMSGNEVLDPMPAPAANSELVGSPINNTVREPTTAPEPQPSPQQPPRQEEMQQSQNNSTPQNPPAMPVYELPPEFVPQNHRMLFNRPRNPPPQYWNAPPCPVHDARGQSNNPACPVHGQNQNPMPQHQCAQPPFQPMHDQNSTAQMGRGPQTPPGQQIAPEPRNLPPPPFGAQYFQRMFQAPIQRQAMPVYYYPQVPAPNPYFATGVNHSLPMPVPMFQPVGQNHLGSQGYAAQQYFQPAPAPPPVYHAPSQAIMQDQSRFRYIMHQNVGNGFGNVEPFQQYYAAGPFQPQPPIPARQTFQPTNGQLRNGTGHPPQYNPPVYMPQYQPPQ